MLCTGDNGEKFLIEVQRGKQENFIQRSHFYTSMLITEDVPKGGDERAIWAYGVKEGYFIGLIKTFTINDNPERYLHDICMCNRETGEIFYNGLGYIYLELVKFVKEEAELISGIDKWLYVLKNMSKMDKIPSYLRKPIFEKLFQVAEYSKMSKEDKKMYDISLKRKWDNQNVLDYARKEGIDEGKRVVALEMKKRGLDIQLIAEITGLSEQEVESL